MAETYSARTESEARVMELMARFGAQSRADIARNLGVMRSTAGNLVTKLVEKGVVRPSPVPDNPPSDRPVGRPGELMELNGDHGCFAGIEVTAAGIRTALVDFSGATRTVSEFEFGDQKVCPEKALHQSADQLRQTVKGSALPDQKPVSLNIALPGVIEGGQVLAAQSLGWTTVDVVDLLGTLGDNIPSTRIINSAQAFAGSNAVWPHSEPTESKLYCWLDRGLSGCFVRGRADATDPTGSIGEIIVCQRAEADRDSEPDRMEKVADLGGLLDTYMAKGGTDKSLEALLAAAASGEESALSTLEDWTNVMSQGVATAISMLSPRQLVIGGALSPVMERVLPSLQDKVKTLRSTHLPLPEFSIPTMDTGIAAVGAARLARAEFFEQQLRAPEAKAG